MNRLIRATARVVGFGGTVRHRPTMLPRYLLRGSKYHWQKRFRALIATVGPPVPNICRGQRTSRRARCVGGMTKQGLVAVLPGRRSGGQAY